ncbi:type II secretion system F family protein [Chengkuizengella axinellae]|uniref:Type II secretion system F family protein n=1 Tax=Chengkuizengella axinellae TaxID=3064388 RepID=A0ABT9J3F3_9BACL|nr:type II secretion system F family protein [Chengkuizengella sp. 2205SS18-9]MDP5276125.1 type II secretion system F family protein [Chengkuizengella sp. 2205SS18-9]
MGALITFLIFNLVLSFKMGLMAAPFGLLLAKKIPVLVKKWRFYFLRKKVLEELEGACMVISSTVRGGLTLLDAYKSTINYVSSPLKEEFETIVNQVQYGGRTLAEAVKGFSKKYESPEIEMLYHATYLATTVGGKEVPSIMKNLSNSIRERKQIDKKIKAKTTYQRISAVTISLIPIMILFTFKFMAPELYQSLLFDARIFLVIGILLTVVAWYFIFKIMNFEDV